MKKSFLLLLATTAVGFLGCKPVGELLSDFSPPSGPEISINGGAALTNSTSVTLSLEAVDAEQMYISNSEDCSGAGSWEAFSSSKSWTLGSTNSTATVSVKYRDKAQNVSACVSDTIVHDGVGPTVSLVGSPASGATINGPVTVTATLSEASTTFASADVTVSSNATVGSFSGSGTSYSFVVTPTSNGAVTIQVGASKFTDAAGNQNTASSVLNYTYDGTAPTVAITSVPATGPTNTDAMTLTFTFSEAVTGFATEDVVVTNATKGTFTAVSSTVYTLAITATGSAVSASVSSSAAFDAGGSGNAAASWSIVYDNTAPTVTITSDQGSVATNTDTMILTFTFSEAVTGFATEDVVVTNATKGTFTAVSSTVYTLAITATGSAVSASVAASSAIDAATNPNTEGSWSITYETTAPVITSASVTTSSPNNDSTPSVQFDLSENATVRIYAVTTGSSAVTACDGTAKGEESFSDITSNPTTKTMMFTLSTNGTFDVYAKATDTAGNVGSCTAVGVYDFDNTAPSSPLVVINSGALSAGSTSVNLTTLSAGGSPTHMFITNDDTACDDQEAGDLGWSAISSPLPWNLSGANNTEFVYAKFKDAAGNVSACASDSIIRVPEVSYVSASNPNGTYGAGQTISVQVVFNAEVDVTGVPQLTLETGASDAVVNYSSGTGSNTLVFDYTIAAGQNTADLDYLSTSALALNSGTIRLQGDTDADLTLPTVAGVDSLGGRKNIRVDTAPVVTSVTADIDDGTYGVGEVIPVQVVFSEVVTVTGTPQLTLETGHNDKVVTYTSGSGSNTLVFNYTVEAGHKTSDLDYKNTNSLVLPTGAFIRDVDGAPANAILTLPAPGAPGSLGANKAIVISTPAQVVGVTTTTGDGPHRQEDIVSIEVEFTEPVIVNEDEGTPYLELQSNSSPLAQAAYASGSESSTLVFNYAVAFGTLGESSADLDYVATDSLKLNGGTIMNGAENANLTLPVPGADGSISASQQVVVDPFPEVVNVTSSSADGVKDVGEVVSIQVVFSEPITVTGSPQLELDTSEIPGADAVATCEAVSNSTTMNCSYTVAYGETSIGPSGPSDALRGRLEYTTTSALALNGGTIVDANETGGNAVLDLPTPGAEYSLSANKEIRTLLGKAVKGEDLTGLTSDLGFGSAVAGAGDLDGNSRPEIIIGAPLKDDGDNPNRGEVYVLTDTGTLFYTVTGGEDNAGFGSAVAGGANVGFLEIEGSTAEFDYLVGAPNASGGGKVYLYEGTTLLHTFSAAANGDQFGTSVALLGDLNEDGFSEIAIGAPGVNADRGAVYIYNGLNGAKLFQISGLEDGARFGAAIANAGDVNDDGLNDLIIGAPNENANGSQSGRVYVYVSSFASSVVGLNYHWDMPGEAAGDHLGTSVAKAGFVDAGSVSDIIVGAPDYDNGANANAGRAYVLNGSTGAALHTVTGDAAGDKLGYSVAGLGDRTSDSKAEFIVGAPFAAAGGTARGIAKVFNGDTGDVMHTLTGANDNEHFGNVVAEVEGNIDGDGHNDFVVAAPDFNTDEGRGHYYR